MMTNSIIYRATIIDIAIHDYNSLNGHESSFRSACSANSGHDHAQKILLRLPLVQFRNRRDGRLLGLPEEIPHYLFAHRTIIRAFSIKMIVIPVTHQEGRKTIDFSRL
jgi:hypothetical protein